MYAIRSYYEQHRHAEIALQLADQVQDLRLDRDVERRRRLVGDQQRRPADERHRDHGALAQPARKLEGVAVHGADRLWKTDAAQHLDHGVAPLALAGQPELLIADEPTTALDVTIQAEILALLAELQQSYNFV